MIIADLAALRVSLDESVVSAEAAAHLEAVTEDLIAAGIAQDAYQKARLALAALDPTDSAAFDYASRTPQVLAQAWVRTLRDIAGDLMALAGDPVTSEAARSAATAFAEAFPGVARQPGPLRVMVAGKDQIYFAEGPARYPVRINDEAVRDLEAIAQGLIARMPKAKPFRAVG